MLLQPAHSLLRNYFPMTGFRRMWGLHIYSGGTVPDFHRISYSLLSPNEFSSTQVSSCNLIITTGKTFVNTKEKGRVPTAVMKIMGQLLVAFFFFTVDKQESSAYNKRQFDFGRNSTEGVYRL